MTVTSFNRGAPPKKEPFLAGMLPLAQKEDLCRNLLAEFGVTNIRHRASDHELIHGCLIDPSHTRQQSEPTASLNYDKLVMRCLGCGARGGLLWFIAQCRGEGSTKDARRWLSKTVGIDGNVMELSDLMRYFDALYDTKSNKVPIPAYSKRMLEPWAFIHPYLTDPRDYHGRGIPEQNVIKMKVGYAEKYRVGRHPDGTDKTSERIVIPHFWKDDLVGWQTRRLASDGTPKYLSSPDFPKDQTIYNHQPSNEMVVVVESMLSVVTHVHALPCMEATFGASVTDTQMRLLAKHPTIVLWMDNDEAGWKAVEGYDVTKPKSGALIRHEPGMGEILGRSSNVLVVENPYAADPGDIHTLDAVALVRDAVPFSVWQRPKTLLCYRCKEVAHDGLCR
jgi:hypothetical protein